MTKKPRVIKLWVACEPYEDFTPIELFRDDGHHGVEVFLTKCFKKDPSFKWVQAELIPITKRRKK